MINVQTMGMYKAAKYFFRNGIIRENKKSPRHWDFFSIAVDYFPLVRPAHLLIDPERPSIDPERLLLPLTRLTHGLQPLQIGRRTAALLLDRDRKRLSLLRILHLQDHLTIRCIEHPQVLRFIVDKRP